MDSTVWNDLFLNDTFSKFYQIVRYDLPLHGKSSDITDYDHLDILMSKSLYKVIESLNTVDFYGGGISLVVFGYGACVSLMTYVRNYGLGRIEQIILINPLFSMTNLKDNRYLTCGLNNDNINNTKMEEYVNLAFNNFNHNNNHLYTLKDRYYNILNNLDIRFLDLICTVKYDFSNDLNLLRDINIYHLNGIYNVFYDGTNYLNKLKDRSNIIYTKNLEYGYMLIMEANRHVSDEIKYIIESDYPTVSEINPTLLLAIVYILLVLTAYCIFTRI